MILESKLNYMSLAELDLEESNAVSILSARLSEMSDIELELVANMLAGIKQVLGVTYDPYNDRWRARRKINGKTIFITQGKDLAKVESAAIDFAKKNNLQIYR